MRARSCQLVATLVVMAGLFGVDAGSDVLGRQLPVSLAAATAPPAPTGITGVLIRCATSEADIFVDGDQIGKTPLADPLPLKAGEHTVRVARLGYSPFIDVFKVKAGQVTKLDVELIPISGVLHVSVKTQAPTTPELIKLLPKLPSSARVFIDDRYMGQPPLETELSIGSHNVRVEQGGYATDAFAVSAVAGQTVEHESLLTLIPYDQNPYGKRAADGTRWYQKWWVWTIGAVGVAAVAAAVIVPIVVLKNNSLCNNVDVCATEMMPTALNSALTTPAAHLPAAGGTGLVIRF